MKLSLLILTLSLAAAAPLRAEEKAKGGPPAETPSGTQPADPGERPAIPGDKAKVGPPEETPSGTQPAFR